MSLIELSWLPPAPPDFRACCTTATDDSQIRKLANYALDLTQLNNLAKATGIVTPDSLTPLRLGLLGNATMQLLVPALIASAARHGLLLEVVVAPFDQSLQAALDPAAPINVEAIDAVLLAFDHRIIPQTSNPSNIIEAATAVESALGQVETVCAGIKQSSGVPVIVQTLASPTTGLLGNFDRRLPGSPHSLIDAFNRRLVEMLDGSGNLLFDVAALSCAVGLETWHDSTQWHLAKLSFSQDAVPLYAEHVARILGALRGKSRKCLVLDLDNTLWGGVIGDDGLEGIIIGQGDPTGEAFVDIQRTVLQLKSLGLVLAVSSKNEDAIARLPFRDHPDMLLQENDFAVFQANWNDKASNLEAIAKALNIGIDALVLLDDNPAERAQVRDALPMVGVPELPDDPSKFPQTLMAAGYFETLIFSDEDQLRASDYTARAQRVELRDNARDMNSFLNSLNMEISFSPFDAAGRGRIVQLINKSNQFNLTTRRYTEHQVEKIENDPTVFTRQVRLKDRFGNAGMISVIICRINNNVWEIDTWLMSCRVLGRRVEEAVLKEIVENVKHAGAISLCGQYVRTERNDLVKDHYKTLGFKQNDDGLWTLEFDTYTPVELPFRIVSTGLAK